ncbi:MAG TPA: ABC transporter ATP-binding protein [Acidobacteriota bacterium]|nr:ABC transporter ATP-binding protein [Acidobacteriota bacterium]
MIRLLQVHYAYRPGEPVLQGADLKIAAGLTLLLGPNGCGKSTLLKLAAGVERPDRGTVEIEGCSLWRDEAAARRNLAYVPEQPDLTPYATITDILRLVCRLRGEPANQGLAALENAGLKGLSGRSIRELSMGQRRRAVLAAAWIGSPRVVLLDEPLESMDRTMREQILAWVERLLDKRSSVVIATHEIEPFMSRAIRAVTVKDGLCRVYDPLPREEGPRTALIEALSRGRQ